MFEPHLITPEQRRPHFPQYVGKERDAERLYDLDERAARRLPDVLRPRAQEVTHLQQNPEDIRPLRKLSSNRFRREEFHKKMKFSVEILTTIQGLCTIEAEVSKVQIDITMMAYYK